MTDTDYDSPPHAGVDSDLGQAKLRQHKRVYGKKGRQNRSGRPGRRRDVTAHSCESEGPCGTRRVVRASRVLKKEKDDVPRDHLSSDAIRDSSDDGSYGSFTGRGKVSLQVLMRPVLESTNDHPVAGNEGQTTASGKRAPSAAGCSRHTPSRFGIVVVSTPGHSFFADRRKFEAGPR